MMTLLEHHIVTLLLTQPYMEVDKNFLLQLTEEARLALFEGFYGSDYCSMDLKDFVIGRDVKKINQPKLDDMKVWLIEQSNNDYVVTDWAMVGFKSEADAALFKLFWL